MSEAEKHAAKVAKRRKTRENVVEEIIATEESFVHDLETLVNVFLPVSRTHLPDAMTQLVFSNIEVLLGVPVLVSATML